MNIANDVLFSYDSIVDFKRSTKVPENIAMLAPFQINNGIIKTILFEIERVNVL
jgi:hypothetical protein